MAAPAATTEGASSRGSTAGPLSSDHVNYLIFRYLQESGFENACKALWRDWHRLPEFKEPEKLPFATAVGRHELISVIQDGLYFDELQAQQTREHRRFQWTGSQSVILPKRLGPVDDEELSGAERRGRANSRPGSRSKRRVQRPGLGGLRAPDEFPTPAAKRQRRSEGADVAVNGGNGMDLDAKTPASVDAEAFAEGDAEVASPAVEEETEIVEMPERYDSMDVATQTDEKSTQKLDTLYWKVEGPDATLDHASWTPATDAKDITHQHLLLAGQNLCRSYEIPVFCSNETEPAQLSTTDPIRMRPNSMVTALAWHPGGKVATFAVDGTRDLPDGTAEPDQQIVDYSAEHGNILYPPGPPLETSSSVVSKMIYNPSGTRLLVLKISVKGGLVQVWNTPSSESDQTDREMQHRDEPAAWCILERMPCDAAWTSDDSFSVCGQQGLFRRFQINVPRRAFMNGLNTPDSFTAESIALHSLEEIQHDRIPSWKATENDFEKLCYDPYHSVTVLLAPNSRALVYCTDGPSTSSSQDLREGLLTLDGNPSDISMRPSAKTSDQDRSPEAATFAITFTSGSCRLYTLSSPLQEPIAVKETDSWHMQAEKGASLSTSWTPDGGHLAVVSLSKIELWRLQDFIPGTGNDDRKQNNRLRREKLTTWVPGPQFYNPNAKTLTASQNAKPNGSGDAVKDGVDEDVRKQVTEPRAAWSSDGESLFFGLEQSIAIIRFRPRLSSPSPSLSTGEQTDDVVVNGK
ncbi:hypothetical protein K431DRAFT_310495 [Polychaeton citri CBS 116435]|uniref:LisH domain-containing protein n=1 Tax=Polychaeton citri CBS 116435 TaxID=1314669 RepID=A0A9P4QG07_9PEZI|nr:hypothetical protein K431DRAFT_310495 [Polychaeton citri CBS 116435]